VSKKQSHFIISLDFELHWGVFDHLRLYTSGQAYFQRTRELIPPTLALFQQHGIRATWATVGLLFARNREEIAAVLPAIRPAYQNAVLNPYPLLDSIGKNEVEDPYHYAPSLIAAILATPGQSIGSHTFSHYYCLEAGQTAASFKADLEAAQALAQQNFGIQLQSLVFPRNQFSPAYLEVLAATHFRSYRTNPAIWFWEASASTTTAWSQKIARLLDHYVPIDQSTAFSLPQAMDGLVDIPASRFFRPYLPGIDGYGGQRLKVCRICDEMTAAATAGLNYHLWWHPHNLATDPIKNMAALSYILEHFRYLHQQFGMESVGMEDLHLSPS